MRFELSMTNILINEPAGSCRKHPSKIGRFLIEGLEGIPRGERSAGQSPRETLCGLVKVSKGLLSRAHRLERSWVVRKRNGPADEGGGGGNG